MVDVDGACHQAPSQRSVPAYRPADHDVAGEHPVVRHANGFPNERLSPIRRPTRHARAETLDARGEQEVLHGRKDGAAEQQLGCRMKALLREQDRCEFACAIVQFVRRAVRPCALAVVGPARIEPAMVIPNAPPTSRVASLTAEATPCLASGAAVMIAEVVGAVHNP